MSVEGVTEPEFFNQSDKNRKAPERPQFSEDKHVATLQAIAKYSKPVQKNIWWNSKISKYCLLVSVQWDQVIWNSLTNKII